MLNQKGNIKVFLIRLVIFLIGTIILSLGIAMMIEANLGVGAWDTLVIGLYKTLGLTIGSWSRLVGITVGIIVFFIDRRIISIGMILNLIVVGYVLDVFLLILPTSEYWVTQYATLLFGLIIVSIGAGLYVSSNLGPGPVEALMLVLTVKTKKSMALVRTLIEITVLTIGWFLGGPVFIGTLIITILIGPFMQVSIKWFNQWLNRFTYNH